MRERKKERRELEDAAENQFVFLLHHFGALLASATILPPASLIKLPTKLIIIDARVAFH